jgi:hypothetical protein
MVLAYWLVSMRISIFLLLFAVLGLLFNSPTYGKQKKKKTEVVSKTKAAKSPSKRKKDPKKVKKRVLVDKKSSRDRKTKRGTDKKTKQRSLRKEKKTSKEVVAKKPLRPKVEAPKAASPAEGLQIIRSALINSQAETVAQSFRASGGELTFQGERKRVGPEEVKQFMHYFYEQYRPQAFTVVHKGETKEGLQYVLGRLPCQPLAAKAAAAKPVTEFPIYLVYRISDGRVQIQNLEIGAEDIKH